MNIIVKKEALLAIAEEISGAVSAIKYLDNDDPVEDAWYYAEQIKTQLFMLSGIIDAAKIENDESLKGVEA